MGHIWPYIDFRVFPTYVAWGMGLLESCCWPTRREISGCSLLCTAVYKDTLLFITTPYHEVSSSPNPRSPWTFICLSQCQLRGKDANPCAGLRLARFRALVDAPITELVHRAVIDPSIDYLRAPTAQKDKYEAIVSKQPQGRLDSL